MLARGRKRGRRERERGSRRRVARQGLRRDGKERRARRCVQIFRATARQRESRARSARQLPLPECPVDPD
eukprot:2901862-Pyramimonas_sp.AAC.1